MCVNYLITKGSQQLILCFVFCFFYSDLTKNMETSLLIDCGNLKCVKEKSRNVYQTREMHDKVIIFACFVFVFLIIIFFICFNPHLCLGLQMQCRQQVIGQPNLTSRILDTFEAHCNRVLDAYGAFKLLVW